MIETRDQKEDAYQYPHLLEGSSPCSLVTSPCRYHHDATCLGAAHRQEAVSQTGCRRAIPGVPRDFYFSAIRRIFRSGGTWIRTGDTMIFSLAWYVRQS